MRVLMLLAGGLGLIVVPTVAQPDSLDRRFAAANEAYAQGRYERAAKGYKSILNADYESVALYHNLGNAHVRLNQVGRAIWAYERGQRLRPDDPRLQHNLEYVRRQAKRPLGGLPPRGLVALVAGWPPFVLFGLGWLALGMGGATAVIKAGSDQYLAWRPHIAWGPVAVGLLLVAVAFGASYVQTHDRRAVVVSERASLRDAPEEAAATSSTVEEGAMVEMEARRAEWIRVRLRDQSMGWMPARALKEI